MPFYRENLPVMRAILARTILTTFALGTLSVVLIRSKVYGLAGIGLGVLAILMGGSKAEAITTERRAISAGLDYFILELRSGSFTRSIIRVCTWTGWPARARTSSTR